jgi:hypothetical protein
MITVREIVKLPGRRPGIGINVGVVYATVTCAALALSTLVTIEDVIAIGDEHVVVADPTFGILRNASRA